MGTKPQHFHPRIKLRDHKDVHVLQNVLYLALGLLINSSGQITEAYEATQDAAFTPHLEYLGERINEILSIIESLDEEHAVHVSVEGEKSFFPMNNLPPIPAVLLPREPPSMN